MSLNGNGFGGPLNRLRIHASRVLLTTVLKNTNDQFRLKAQKNHRFPAPQNGQETVLYVHIPFCEQLCPYCSFNRFPINQRIASAYHKQLREEMRRVADLGYDFPSMYVGGGTPTIMLDELIETIDLAKSLFSIREISTETNPNHLTPEVVDQLEGRVNRFSVGVQSFNDDLLKQMDRYEKYGSGAQILERLQSISGRFDTLNVDMIFNFPNQTEEILLRDVELFKETGADQVTFYPLMVSHSVKRSLSQTLGEVSYEREARYYALLNDAMAGDLAPVSAWAFAHERETTIDEYIVEYSDYLGIGSGSFSYLNGQLFVNTFSLNQYGKLIESGKMSVDLQRNFGRHDQMRYRFMTELFGLRLDKNRFKADFGLPIELGLPLEMAFMTLNGAFKRNTPDELVLSIRGRYLVLVMMREFFVGVNGFRDQARANLPLNERSLLFGSQPLSTPASAHQAGETQEALP